MTFRWLQMDPGELKFIEAYAKTLEWFWRHLSFPGLWEVAVVWGVSGAWTASLHFPIRSLAQTNEWDDCEAEAGFCAVQWPYAEPWVISMQTACLSLLDYMCYPENTQQCLSWKKNLAGNSSLFLLGRGRDGTDWRSPTSLIAGMGGGVATGWLY